MTYVISKRQSIKLHTTLGDLGITDRDRKLTVVSACIYRDITSTADLNWHEASVAINTLQSVAAVRDDRAGALERLVDIAQRRMAATA